MRLGRHRELAVDDLLEPLRDATGDLTVQLRDLVTQLEKSAKAGGRMVSRARSAQEAARQARECGDDRDR